MLDGVAEVGFPERGLGFENRVFTIWRVAVFQLAQFLHARLVRFGLERFLQSSEERPLRQYFTVGVIHEFNQRRVRIFNAGRTKLAGAPIHSQVSRHDMLCDAECALYTLPAILVRNCRGRGRM